MLNRPEENGFLKHEALHDQDPSVVLHHQYVYEYTLDKTDSNNNDDSSIIKAHCIAYIDSTAPPGDKNQISTTCNMLMLKLTFSKPVTISILNSLNRQPHFEFTPPIDEAQPLHYQLEMRHFTHNENSNTNLFVSHPVHYMRWIDHLLANKLIDKPLYDELFSMIRNLSKRTEELLNGRKKTALDNLIQQEKYGEAIELMLNETTSLDTQFIDSLRTHEEGCAALIAASNKYPKNLEINQAVLDLAISQHNSLEGEEKRENLKTMLIYARRTGNNEMVTNIFFELSGMPFAQYPLSINSSPEDLINIADAFYSYQKQLKSVPNTSPTLFSASSSNEGAKAPNQTPNRPR